MSNWRLPAEWEAHESTWLAWPHNQETWEKGILQKVQAVYTEFIAKIAQGELVHVLFPNEENVDVFDQLFKKHSFDQTNIVKHLYNTNDAWIRDYGPDFLIDDSGRSQLVNWEYNAWGAKYPPFDSDNKAPYYIAEFLGNELLNKPMVLEGGSFDSNGDGYILTTEACLLHPNRNPNLTVSGIEKELKATFNLKAILWLKDGIAGDDTDGHIDDFARFVAKDRILIATEERISSSNYLKLKQSKEALLTELNKVPYDVDVIDMPMPTDQYAGTAQLPASYLNFYVTNRSVIVPVFACEKDAEALSIIASVFPNREVIGLDSRSIILGLGSFHCLSKQQPKC